MCMTNALRYAAFTTTPDTGNPAGVVLDATTMTDEDMQATAAEIGYSETAFAVPIADRHYRVRYFSPLAEVAFCGHATIALAVALAERDGTGTFTFETNAGEIPVTTTTQDTVVATLTSVPTHSRPATQEELTEALKALRWRPEDVNPQWPPHVAFAGNNHLILAAATRTRLATLNYDFEALKSLMLKANWTTAQLFWPESDTLIHSRNPFPVGGVVEDPATGAAAAALGGYLRTLGKAPGLLTIIQGEDMGRRSELRVTVSPDTPRVTVTGAATRIEHQPTQAAAE
jgi:PhzF family phenazine biosynthesis protein